VKTKKQANDHQHDIKGDLNRETEGIRYYTTQQVWIRMPAHETTCHTISTNSNIIFCENGGQLPRPIYLGLKKRVRLRAEIVCNKIYLCTKPENREDCGSWDVQLHTVLFEILSRIR
jgi:hypothetical protein